MMNLSLIFLHLILFSFFCYGQNKLLLEQQPIVGVESKLESEEINLFDAVSVVPSMRHSESFSVQKLFSLMGERDLSKVISENIKLSCWSQENTNMGYCYTCQYLGNNERLNIDFYTSNSKCNIKWINYNIKNLNSKKESQLIDAISSLLGSNIKMLTETNKYIWVTPIFSIELKKSATEYSIVLKDENLKQALKKVNENKNFLYEQILKSWQKLKGKAENYLHEISPKDFPKNIKSYDWTEEELNLRDKYKENKNIQPIVSHLNKLLTGIETTKSKEKKSCFIKKIFEIESFDIFNAELAQINSLPGLFVIFDKGVDFLRVKSSFDEMAKKIKLEDTLCFKLYNYDLILRDFKNAYNCDEKWDRNRRLVTRFSDFLKSKPSVAETHLMKALKLAFTDSNVYHFSLKNKYKTMDLRTKDYYNSKLMEFEKEFRHSLQEYGALGEREKKWVNLKRSWHASGLHPDPIYFKCQFTK